MWLGAIASFGHVLTNIHRLSASGLQQDFRPSGSAASDVSGFRSTPRAGGLACSFPGSERPLEVPTPSHAPWPCGTWPGACGAPWVCFWPWPSIQARPPTRRRAVRAATLRTGTTSSSHSATSGVTPTSPPAMATWAPSTFRASAYGRRPCPAPADTNSRSTPLPADILRSSGATASRVTWPFRSATRSFTSTTPM